MSIENRMRPLALQRSAMCPERIQGICETHRECELENKSVGWVER